jgi:hypothetical protein
MTMLRFLRALLMSAGGLLGWLGRTLFQGLTGRSLAAEAAEEADAHAREVAAQDAQEQAQADRNEAASRHEETAALIERQIAESRALREELVRQAQRREQIKAKSRSHDPEIRSSRWKKDDDEPEPESGAPMCAYA